MPAEIPDFRAEFCPLRGHLGTEVRALRGDLRPEVGALGCDRLAKIVHFGAQLRLAERQVVNLGSQLLLAKR